jgi:pimeloyl-ACP methyl ester carboxylesterase
MTTRREPEERITEVDGRTVRWYDAGSGTTPTVVLESGLGHSAAVWAVLQRQLAESTRVVSYDRAGYGGSSPGPVPRTAMRLAEELHQLLSAVHVPAPYLLVGHSWGGVIVRTFADLYPAHTAGLVLIDASHESIGLRTTGLTRAMTRLNARSLQRSIASGRLERRLRNGETASGRWIATYPDSDRARLIEDACQATAVRAAVEELHVLNESLDRVAEQVGPPDVPFTAITGGRPASRLEARSRARINAAYADMAAGARDGRHLVSPQSGHLVVQEDTPLVCAEVLRLQRLLADQREDGRRDALPAP